jgi:hypothetical protein
MVPANYFGGRLLASMLGVYNSDLIMRLKPWEAYKAQENESKGLLACLDQEDVDRVSSIYFT